MTKKVNYVYQNAEKDPVSWEPTEDSEESEIEYILEEEVEEDDECVDDDETVLNTSDRNCYAIKKSGTKCSTYEKDSQEGIPYFQVS